MRYEILSKIRYEIQSEITRLIRIVIFKYDKCRIPTVYLVQSEYLHYKYLKGVSHLVMMFIVIFIIVIIIIIIVIIVAVMIVIIIIIINITRISRV